MKVRLYDDDCPHFIILPLSPDKWHPGVHVNIPEGLYQRYLKSEAEFDSVQKELAAIYNVQENNNDTSGQ